MNRLARCFNIALVAGVISACASFPAHGQAGGETKAGNQAVEEKEECISNLKAISQALDAYQRDHKDLPNWLSDLVPDYLSDANLLVCPVCKRTGQIEAPPLADPKLSSSYLFEFCPVPLGQSAPATPEKTRKEWKRRQMGLAGSSVPVVRCRHHSPVLNLAFDGRIYESPSMWETLLTNRLSIQDLTAPRIFADDAANRKSGGPAPNVVRQFAKRDPMAPKELLDLSPFYNAMLTESWHGGSGNDLAGLPTGLQELGGVTFDVRGIVQVGSKSPSGSRYPMEIRDIPVHQKCQQVHFLHSAAFGLVPDEGKHIGTYVVHYAANQMRLEVPISYGREVRNWHWLSGESELPKSLQVAWSGENAVSRRAKAKIRLFMTTWTNLVPSVEIQSIDCVASTNSPALFVVGITVE